jgi:isocitrate dehydrogenase kinase/phosphatase
VFRDLPAPTCEEEETSAEPWFHCGPQDVFPEQWLPFLAIPSALRDVFLKYHADLLTAAWWRTQPPHPPHADHFVLPRARAVPAA